MYRSAAVTKRIQVAAVQGVAEQRAANTHRCCACGQPLPGGVKINAARRHCLQVGEWATEMLEVGGAHGFGGEDLDCGRARFPAGGKLGGQSAGEDRIWRSTASLTTDRFMVGVTR